MSIALLDVSVLVPLLIENHQFRPAARAWMVANASAGWATCSITQSGFVRVAAQMGVGAMAVQDGLKLIHQACSASSHRFWHLNSPLNEMLPELRRSLIGPKQITDAVLLDLAIRNNGRLVTLDHGIRRLLPEASPHQAALEVIAI